MKRVLHISVLSAMLLALLTSCNPWKDFEVSSVSVRSISPKGLKAADLTVVAKIDNPGKAVQIDSISGVIRVEDNPILLLTAYGILIESGERDCIFPVKGSLQSGINLPSVLGALTSGDTETLVVDIRGYARMSGSKFGKTIEYTDIPLVSLVKR